MPPTLLILHILSGTSVYAKDVRQLWYMGGSLAYHNTLDSIRSNADMPGDPRPDSFAGRETTIEDTGSLSLTAGFGVTDWLNLQVDVGWFRGQVGPIGVFLSDRFPVSGDPSRPEVLNQFKNRQITIPISAGRITEMPVTLSGVVRFRKDRIVNPYLEAGIGMMFTGLDGDEDVERLDARLGRLRITDETNEAGGNLVPARFQPFSAEGRIPLTYPLTIGVENAFEWHLAAGMEHFFSDRLSVVAAVRYTAVNPRLVVDLKGQDQVDFHIFSEKLFRPDGSLKIFNNQGVSPNPLVDPTDPGKGRIRCTTNSVGDFDQDGHADDLCYTNNAGPSADDPIGVLLVQGGSINLSGYTIHIGMRFYF